MDIFFFKVENVKWLKIFHFGTQYSEIDITEMLHAQGFVQHFSPQNLFNFHDFHTLWGRSINLAYMT